MGTHRQPVAQTWEILRGHDITGTLLGKLSKVPLTFYLWEIQVGYRNRSRRSGSGETNEEYAGDSVDEKGSYLPLSPHGPWQVAIWDFYGVQKCRHYANPYWRLSVQEQFIAGLTSHLERKHSPERTLKQMTRVSENRV